MKLIFLRNITVAITFIAASSGCAIKETAPKIVSLNFEPLSLPNNNKEKTSIRISRHVTAEYNNGEQKVFPLKYHTLYRSGDKDAAGNVVGMTTNIKGENIKVSNRPDGTSVIWRSEQPHVITQFEEHPGGVYAAALTKDNEGEYSATKFSAVDFRPVGGTLTNCAASKTPWGTHLTPEEDYNLDAYLFDDKTAKFEAKNIKYCEVNEKGKLTGKYQAPAFSPKTKNSKLCNRVKGIRDAFFAGEEGFTPYNYGSNLEIALDEVGKPYIVNGRKHYVFGKASPEMALVMPDEKTVYIGNDSVYRPLLRLVADQAQDLSSGTLYTARWQQTSNKNGGSANLKWIKLGHATDSDIENYIKRDLRFTDFFDVAEAKTCPANSGYRKITVGEPGLMCLRLRDGSKGSNLSEKFKNINEFHQAAAFLETMKYSVWLGGSAEFYKGEGLTYNPDRNVLYFAISSITKSMQDNYKGKESENHIHLPANRCGGVYEISLDKNYVANTMSALVTGRLLKAGEEHSDINGCHPEHIASPDNLRYIGYDTLIIGEDATEHFNNMAFAFNLKTKKLTRIMTAPTGGEITGTFARFDTKDQTRLMANIQHPLKDNFYNVSRKNVNKLFLKNATSEEQRGYVGYISGMPLLPLQ